MTVSNMAEVERKAASAFDQLATVSIPCRTGGFDPLWSSASSAEVAIVAKAVIPATVFTTVFITAKAVIPAQAGSHDCAGRRLSCSDSGLPAPRQALPGSRFGCGCQRLRAGTAWRSTLVAAKARAPRPQRFTGAVGAAPDCPAMPGLVAASRNSLRSLRSLRSNSPDKAVDESRYARGRQCSGVRTTEHHKRSVAPGAVRRGAGRPRSRHDERRHAQPWIPACAGMTAMSPRARKTATTACAGMTATTACAGMANVRFGHFAGARW